MKILLLFFDHCFVLASNFLNRSWNSNFLDFSGISIQLFCLQLDCSESALYMHGAGISQKCGQTKFRAPIFFGFYPYEVYLLSLVGQVLWLHVYSFPGQEIWVFPCEAPSVSSSWTAINPEWIHGKENLREKSSQCSLLQVNMNSPLVLTAFTAH